MQEISSEYLNKCIINNIHCIFSCTRLIISFFPCEKHSLVILRIICRLSNLEYIPFICSIHIISYLVSSSFFPLIKLFLNSDKINSFLVKRNIVRVYDTVLNISVCIFFNSLRSWCHNIIRFNCPSYKVICSRIQINICNLPEVISYLLKIRLIILSCS